MKLIVVHQILIGSAIALAVIFGIRALVLFTRTDETVNLVLSIAAGLVAVALALYLRKVRAKWAKSRVSVPPTGA